jgi:hypothetical protein
MNTRNLEEQIIAASLGYDRDDTEILLACRIAGFANAVITYPEHGLRRLLHAIRHDSDPTLTAQLDAVDAYTDEANKVLDALNERVPFAEPPSESCGIDYLDAGERAALDYGDFDLGSRFTISGGEIQELDARTMGDDDNEHIF